VTHISANSLQTRFIAASVAVLLVCGLLAGLGGYRAAIVEAGEILDTQLAQLVQTLLFLSRADTSNTAGDIGLSSHSEHSYMVFQVWKLKPGGDQLNSSPQTRLSEAKERPYPQLLLRSGEIDSKLLFVRKDGFSTASWGGHSFRVYAQTSPNGEFRAIVGQDLIDRTEMVDQIAWSNARPYLLVLPIGVIALIWLTYRGLAPIRRLTVEVAARDPAHLRHLEIEATPKELWPLLQAINTLLDRLGNAMEHERRFTGDAAHELRTPMAALRAQLDALRLADNKETRIQAQQQASTTAERMARLVNQLLTLARLDVVAIEQDTPLNLSELARELCGDVAPTAVAKNINLSLHAVPTKMRGEEEALRILLRNLLDNALRYTPGGGRIQVLISQRAKHTRLTVADNGPGVPDAQLAELGQRFNRLGRSDATGVGLGLSIVLRIVERYRATLTFGKGLESKGLAVTVDFPERPV
jgi:two-component system sensor histidine kinase QseC